MRSPLVFALALLLSAGSAVADKETRDAVAEFKKLFATGMTRATREKAVDALAEVAHKDALDGFSWGFELTVKHIRKLIIEKDDNLEELRRLEKELLAIQRRAAEAAKKAGLPPPKTFTAPPGLIAGRRRARAKAESLQKDIDREYTARKALAEGIGRWLPKLSAEHRSEVFEEFERKRLKDRNWAARAFYTKALGKTETKAATRLLLVRLAEEKDRRVLPIVIDALAEQAGEVALPELLPLLSDPRWQIRVAVVTGLARIGNPRAIQPLIDRLRAETGRLRGDISDALKKLTGKDFGILPDRWQEWWDQNRGSFVPPEPAPPKEDEPAEEPEDTGPPDGKAGPMGPPKREPPPPPPPDGRQPPPDEPPPPDAGDDKGSGASFYGIRVLSKRIIFVIDVSGSMNDPASGKDQKRTKIAVAKRELKTAVLGLPDDARLNIVFYNETVSVWKKTMVKAERKERKAAVEFVEEFEAVGATNVHDALKQAFDIVGMGARDKKYKPGADTIFFLSDGMPTVGTVIDPKQIVKEVKRWNHARAGGELGGHLRQAVKRRTPRPEPPGRSPM
ncbi:MAG: HEAT repeat domain-containing protein [Planctomycetota bacterium]|jgi:hypothetical protein